MNGIFGENSYLTKIIVLTLAASILTGCAQTTQHTEDLQSGLSPIEQVGIGIGAAIAAVAIGTAIYNAVNENEANEAEEQAQKDWVKKGPVLAAQYTLSDLSVDGFVQGGWPIAVDFQMRRPGRISLKVGAKDIAPYSIAMDGSATTRKLQIFRIPLEFGANPKFAKVQIVAMDGSDDSGNPIPVKIFGIACGPRAVSSIGIDQVNFGPGSVQLSLQQQASFSFFSHKSFGKVSAAFRKVEDKNGVIQISDIVKEESINIDSIDETQGMWIRTNKGVPLVWNGKAANNKPSQGFHVLQIRAWYDDDKKRDWGVALSADWVEVKQ